MHKFLKALDTQRWDDHRYYHQSRINQVLHLISAVSFLCAYVVLFFDPATAALIGWLVSMLSRQAGHFFFEPLCYDTVNQATQEYKESIKVGYNLRRKVVLMAVWALSPVALYVDPTLFGLFDPEVVDAGYLHRLGLLWLAIGVGGLMFRMANLFILQNVQTGVVWVAKIMTDPFHDVGLYYKSPVFLLRVQMLDPILSEEHTEQHA